MKLPANFAEKRVTVVADTPTDVSFGPAEFEAHTGVAELTRATSVQIDMTNDINFSVSISMRYETRVDVTPLLDSKANRAVPPNSSLRVNAVNLPSLANIKPRCERIVVTLRSLGSGQVTVRLRLDEAQQASAEGAGQIGTLGTTFGEYNPIQQTVLLTNTTSFQTGLFYAVPAERRFFVDNLFLFLEATPVRNASLNLSVRLEEPFGPATQLYQLDSDITQDNSVSVTPANLIIVNPQELRYSLFSQFPTGSREARITLIGREVAA